MHCQGRIEERRRRRTVSFKNKSYFIHYLYYGFESQCSLTFFSFNRYLPDTIDVGTSNQQRSTGCEC